MTFFLSWATWAKLTFVLGCSLAIVLTLAGVVTYLKLKTTHSHELLCTEQQLERGDMAINTRLDGEIPFGIRAMEEEPDVEGVWNSRTVTPLHTPIMSPRLGTQESRSLRNVLGRLTHSRQCSSNSSLSRLEVGESVDEKDLEGLSASMTSSTCHTISNTDNVLHSATQNNRPTGRVSLDTDHFINESRLNNHDTSSNNFYTPLKSLSPISNPEAGIESSIVTNERAKRSRTIVIGNYSCEDTVRLIRSPSALRNLEILYQTEAHRQHHAAESGQLLPRMGHTTHGSLDCAQYRSIDGALNQEATRSVSWPMTSEEIIVSMKSSSKLQNNHRPFRIPFQAHAETQPHPKPPPSSWTRKTQERLDGVLDAKAQHIVSTMPTHNPNSSRSSTSSASEAQSTSSLSICNTNTRKVNPGFEILPAGTFQNILQKAHEQWSEPPQERLDDIKRPAKLQKRNRSQSQGSRSSLEMSKPSKENVRATVF